MNNNNNIPNNFNNGMSNNMNFNNDPVAREANEQLIGGQSSLGNGPDVMQGIPNVQNNPGIMQGFNNVQNPNTVMQGIENVSQNISDSVPMPGQFNSGINNYTMQVERPQENSTPNDSIMTNVEPTIPNSDTNIPNFASSQPIDVNVGGISTTSQVNPQMNMNANSNVFDNLRTDNPVDIPTNNLNSGINSVNSFDRPMVDVGIPSGLEVNTKVNEQPEMPLPQTENAFINPMDTMPQSFNTNQSVESNASNIDNSMVDIENVNQSMPNVESINNEKPNINIQGSLDNTVKIPNPFAMDNENLQANLNGQMNNETQIPQTNIVDAPINSMPEENPINMEQSSEINQMPMGEPVFSPVMDQPQVMDNSNINNQIGNTQDLNSFVEMPQQPNFNNNVGQPMPQMNNYQSIDMPQEKVKSFPLSLRETILVSIALIGIIAVVIIYWPN